MDSKKCDTNKITYKIETDSDFENKLMLPKRKGEWEGIKLGVWD